MLTDEQVHPLRQILVVKCNQFSTVDDQRGYVQQRPVGDVTMVVSGSVDLINRRLGLSVPDVPAKIKKNKKKINKKRRHFNLSKLTRKAFHCLT